MIELDTLNGPCKWLLDKASATGALCSLIPSVQYSLPTAQCSLSIQSGNSLNIIGVKWKENEKEKEEEKGKGKEKEKDINKVCSDKFSHMG